MATRTIDKPVPWSELTAEEQEEVRQEFEAHVAKGGADLTIGLYRHTPADLRSHGARGKWCMSYC